MAKVWVQLDDSQLRKKILRIKKELDTCSEKTSMDLAEKGKWIAKFLAPKWSGKTSDFIIARKSPVKGQSRIIARNPTADRNFNLVRWMHETNGILDGHKHIYSGDPRFMYSTRIELNRIKRRVAQGNYSKINIK
jgi:hypothetical protein